MENGNVCLHDSSPLFFQLLVVCSLKMITCLCFRSLNYIFWFRISWARVQVLFFKRKLIDSMKAIDLLLGLWFNDADL